MAWYNGYVTITNITHEFDDFVELDDGQLHIVDYTEDVPFFVADDMKHYLNKFIKVD